jgi:hypothetical protein
MRWVLERGQRVVGEDGQAWLHGIIFDITARKEAEEMLRERAAEPARIAKLEAARIRIIAAQDAARREMERNLHDGAQQQLVTTACRVCPQAEPEPSADTRIAGLRHRQHVADGWRGLRNRASDTCGDTRTAYPICANRQLALRPAKRWMARDRIELSTPRFSVACSTN